MIYALFKAFPGPGCACGLIVLAKGYGTTAQREAVATLREEALYDGLGLPSYSFSESAVHTSSAILPFVPRHLHKERLPALIKLIISKPGLVAKSCRIDYIKIVCMGKNPSILLKEDPLYMKKTSQACTHQGNRKKKHPFMLFGSDRNQIVIIILEVGGCSFLLSQTKLCKFIFIFH